MRSRVYGGQSAEVTTIINESRLLDCVRGMILFPKKKIVLLKKKFFLPEMGFLNGDSPEPVEVFMYDGAGTRADIGPQVRFVIPAGRFQDGDQLLVRFFFFCFCVLRFEIE